jgi:hypothetical protein
MAGDWAYKPRQKGSMWSYDPKRKGPYRISRSKIDLFVECPRCFFIDQRMGVMRPASFPFNLNSAVDALLKKEFDSYRAKGKAHPLMEAYGVDAVPMKHKDLELWREALKGGVEFLHEGTQLSVRGAVDDLWVKPNGEVIVVDYKATSKDGEVSLDAEWQNGYKRQMEVYQWILRKMGYAVSERGYFVYCNGKTDREAFDGKLEFDVKVIPYDGNPDWVEDTVNAIKECLDGDQIPESGPSCDYCKFVMWRGRAERGEM